MSSLPRLALPVAAALLAACGTTTRFVATNPSPRPLTPRPAAEVHVYTTGAPALAYVEVGILQARQSSDFSTHEMPEIIAELRAEAGKIGCDGVIINGTADTAHGSTVVTRDGVSSSHSTLEGYWGACIVYVDDGDGEVAR